MINFSELKKLIPHEHQRGCFGKCETSPINKQLILYTDGKAIYTQFQPLERHIGWGNILHGGILTTIMDEILGWEAVLLAKMVCVTKKIEVQFHHPAQFDDSYTITAKYLKHTQSEIIVDGEVYNSGNILIMSATGVFSPLPAQAIDKLGIMPPEQLQLVLEYIKSIEKA
ncbi:MULTISPECIES: PaaI family thioesterase [Cysteiniphilum]|uniref:Thioesterase n=1 Tax=Cysteiniphilum litorale TaxID=2056700 RepID=A0A8J3EB95_9GAMM|nr:MULTISPECIES: PaaI family thioesterase [Cysteiniphilum]GGG08501.1 thioesterase [Cysteiniphilum litorale]